MSRVDVPSVRGLLAALAFFTRLPAPDAVHRDERALAAAPAHAPLAGVVVGAMAAGALWAGAQVLPLTLAVVLSTALALWVTGALHEDGLADLADGFGASRSRERVLAIMRDSRIGAYGVIALVVTLALKTGALLALSSPPHGSIGLAGAVLVAGHALSRLACVSLLATHPYARASADSRFPVMVRPMSARTLAVAAACGGVPLLLLALLDAAPLALAALAALAAREWLGALVRRRLGGFTGDCLGAVQQVSEVAFLLGACALLPLVG